MLFRSRTWKQDFSINYLSTGMLVSCKIDGIRDNNTDDHIILAALYGASGALVSAQATIRMENEANVDSGSVMFKINEDNTYELIQVTSSGTVNLSASYSDIPDALHDILNNSLKAMSGYNSFPNERKKLAHIVKNNLNWMNSAIKIKKQ